MGECYDGAGDMISEWVHGRHICKAEEIVHVTLTESWIEEDTLYNKGRQRLSRDCYRLVLAIFARVVPIGLPNKYHASP